MDSNLTVITFLHPNEKHLNRCLEGLKSQKIPFNWLVLGFNAPKIEISIDNCQFIKLPKEINNKAAAYNFILPQIFTKYIAFNDADDKSLPERFATQMNYLETNLNIDILGGGLIINGKHRGWEIYGQDQFIKAAFWLKNPMVNSAIMLRNKPNFWGYTVKYDESLNRAEDYQFWLDCAKLNLCFANLSIPVIDYFQTKKSNQDKEQSTANAIRIEAFKYFIGKDIPKEIINFFHQFANKGTLKTNEMEEIKTFLELNLPDKYYLSVFHDHLKELIIPKGFLAKLATKWNKNH